MRCAQTLSSGSCIQRCPLSSRVAFAVGLAAALRNIWVELPPLVHAFSVIALGGNLVLDIAKCVRIPLWRYDISHAKRIIAALIPELKQISISWSARYLGIQVGPSAVNSSWSIAVHTCSTRVRLSSILGTGNCLSTLVVRTYATSVLHFASPCLPPSSKNGQQYRYAIAVAYGAPLWWMLHQAAVRMTRMKCGTSQSPDISIITKAAMFRRLFSQAVELGSCRAILAQAGGDDAEWLGARFQGWRPNLIFSHRINFHDEMRHTGWFNASCSCIHDTLHQTLIDEPWLVSTTSC